MGLRSEVWTVVIVSIVTALIWMWAAGETREQASVSAIVQFTPSDALGWTVSPSTEAVTLTIEGSRLALQEAVNVLRTPLPLELGSEHVPAETGLHLINLADALADHPRIREARLSVLSTEPTAVQIDVDKIVNLTVPVVITLPPTLRTEGDVQSNVTEATLSMPSRLVPNDRSLLAAETVVDPRQLEQLMPGNYYTLDFTLRPTGSLRNVPEIRVDPPTAQISLTVQSRTRQIVLPRVAVQIQSAPVDLDEFVVSIDDADKFLRDVTVTADSDLISRIESGDIKVFAIVYLSTSDKDQHIDSKPVTSFVALLPDNTLQTLAAQVGDTADPPIIHLQITERPAP